MKVRKAKKYFCQVSMGAGDRLYIVGVAGDRSACLHLTLTENCLFSVKKGKRFIETEDSQANGVKPDGKFNGIPYYMLGKCPIGA